MVDERTFIIDLLIIIGAATGGGVIAGLLRLPVIVGYLVAGLVVANLPGWEIEVDEIQNIAELGVALLLFTIGVQFSVRRLIDIRRVAIVGGIIQIAATIALGFGIGSAFGLDVNAAVVLGAAMALSSTMVVLKLLDARGDLDAPHGRVALGILLVQDLAVVPLVILIPAAVDATGLSLARELGLAAGKAVLLLGAAYVLGLRVVPQLLHRIAATGSRELFLLAVLSLALTLAGGSFLLGLSLAFGAFLAGLVVSESEFSYQTLAEVLPLREVFATIFFVAMGMLIEPSVLTDEPYQIAAVVAALVVGKLVIAAGAVIVSGYPPRVGLLAGFGLAQAGEFSFVLARVAVDEEIISDELNSVILMATLLSILISPFMLPLGSRLVAWAQGAPRLSRLVSRPPIVEVDEADLDRHVVVCGYGRVGRELVREITVRGFRCVVIEENPYLVEQLRRQGISRIYGDAANPAVLRGVALDKARLLCITVADPAVAQLVLSYAKSANPRLDVVARARASEDHDILARAGASEVIYPEFEAGLEFVRHMLHRYGVDRTQIQAVLARRRRDFLALPPSGPSIRRP